MIRRAIRGGMGLGDALYVQSVCRHLVERGQVLRVHTAWPDVFRYLGPGCKTAPFKRAGIEIVAHYPQRKRFLETTQFRDCCLSAGITEPVDLRLDWKVANQALVDAVLSDGRPVVLVQLPRAPMGRTDGFGADLLPDCRAIQKVIDRWRERALLVQVGSGRPLFQFEGIELDLAGRTTVCDVLDLASIASAFVGYVSFFVPLAESFNRPSLSVWSRRGLKSGVPYVAQITPKKILHKPTSRFVMDDATDDEIREASDALL